MDANALPESADYEKLPESYVIFITEMDVLGKGKPLYVIRRTIEGDGELFDDGSHIVYVNSSIADVSTPLGQLMHDFRCAKPEEMYYDILAERTGAFKKTKEGVLGMSSMWEQFKEKLIEEAMEQGMAQGMAQGMEQGIEKTRLTSIRGLMDKLSLTAEKAMDVLSIPQSEWGRYKAML